MGDLVKHLAKYSEKIQVIDWYTMWARTNINQNWSKKTHKMLKIAERFKTAKIVQLRFLI